MASDNILVAIKSRPFINRETNLKLKPQWVVQEKEKAIFQVDDEGHRVGEPYSFDHIFLEESNNEAVYDTVVKPLVKSCLKGFNSTIFAYGQTSSGKTYTMMGNNDKPGINQLAVQDIFQHVEDNPQRRYLISCSYFEIYKEKINDLFDKNGQDLKIREDICGNTFVNAKQELVTQAAQVFNLMKIGNKSKKIGSTNMNERSSRSHTIFRFTFESTEIDIQNGPVQISQLNLVDLAGSERVAQTKEGSTRFTEGVTINKSLSVLGNVIRQLSDDEKFVSYRDSKITRLLQHALGGNAKALIIATITLAIGEETKSTLEFAQRAKIIKNRPIINEILTEQDKLKQCEIVTAIYKERLQKETKRVLSMQREKEQKEEEILKLKEHFKIVNAFLIGTAEDLKRRSKIPRRHTVGHYGTHPVLQSIPEASVLPSTSADTEIERGTKHDTSYEEDPESSGEASGGFENGTSSTTEEDSSQTMRIRLRHLEESYASLKEFTRLEVECKDKSLVEDLKKEKEALIKDLTDYNTIIKEDRQEFQNTKMKLENEITSLKNELDLQKKQNIDSICALEQANKEMATLRKSKDDEIEDLKFVVEHQKSNHESEVNYLKEEIDRLNNELEADDEKDWREGLQQEVNDLKAEICSLKDLKDDIQTKSQDKIAMLEEKIVELQTLRSQEESDLLNERRTNEALEREMKIINDKIDHLQNENNELQLMTQGLKQNLNTVETENSELSTKVDDYEKITLHLTETIDAKTLEYDELKAELEKTEKVMTKTEYYNIELQQNVNDLKDMIKSMEMENGKLLEKLYSSQQESKIAVRQTEKENLKLRTEIEQKEERIKILMEDMTSLTCENEDLKIKMEDMVEEKKKVDVQNKHLETTIKLLNDKVEKLNGYNCKLTLDLTTYKEKVGDLELEKLIVKFRDHFKPLDALKIKKPPEEENQTEMAATSASSLTVEVGDDIEVTPEQEELLLKKVVNLTTENVKLKNELDIIKKDVSHENSLMAARIRELESIIVGFKNRIETVHRIVSASTYRVTADLSPREIRRRKRQSIHDQRRRIDVEEPVNVGDPVATSLQQDEIEATLTRLETEIRYLTSSQREDELKALKQEVEELKLNIEQCQECKVKDIQIHHLENLGKKNIYKIVELETKFCDFETSYKIEREAREDKIEYMKNRILSLETELENNTENVKAQCSVINEELHRKETEDLKNQIKHLASENEFLEFEVQGFSRELNDYRRYNKEQENEIKAYKDEIDKLKTKCVKCRMCEIRQKRINDLDVMQKTTMGKIGELQTKVYDLKQENKVQKANLEDRIQFMQNHIIELEERIVQLQPKEVNTAGIQCDLVDYTQFHAKYTYMKRLAQIRREEGNRMRARLGIPPDQPVD